MPRKTQFTADEIVEAAVDLVKENGWDGLSVKAVAQKIGSSTMPVYSHFDNLEKLKDAVVVKGWDTLMEYEGKHYTGDAWVDQSIGYIRFATDETKLFHCMFDGRNLELQRQRGFKNWIYLLKLLKNYEGFEGLEAEQIFLTRYSRAVYTHGLAASVTARLWGKLLDVDGMIENLVVAGSHAILEGYRKTYDCENETFAFLDKEIKRTIELGKIKLRQEEDGRQIE